MNQIEYLNDLDQNNSLEDRNSFKVYNEDRPKNDLNVQRISRCTVGNLNLVLTKPDFYGHQIRINLINHLKTDIRTIVQSRMVRIVLSHRSLNNHKRIVFNTLVRNLKDRQVVI